MSEKRIKVIGEGGVHLHKMKSPELTEKDGIHKHIFFISDRLLMTDLSGAHTHKVSPTTNTVGEEVEKHKHAVQIATKEGLTMIQTKEGGAHSHELQSGSTTLSGLHIHELELGGETYVSMLPGDLIQAVEDAVKTVPAFKNFKVREDESQPLEMDFETVKRLNKADFKDVLKKACVVTIMKSLSRLKDGFQIESLILTRDRYSDIGAAERFVMDHGIESKSSEEITAEGVFVFRINSKDRFVESSLQRVRVTEGVTAVVGLMDEDEIGQQVQENKPEQTEQAPDVVANPQAAQVQNPEATAVDGTIDELQDELKGGANMKSISSLRERFNKTKSSFGDTVSVQKRHVTKEEPTTPPQEKKSKNLFDWKSGKPITGSVLQTITEIAEKNEVKRKFVTVEYPQQRFIKFLTKKYEIIHAVYENAAKKGDDKEFKSLHVHADHLDAFLVKTDGYRESLVIFFDDEDKLDEVFKTDIQNYTYGAYSYKQTMMGPILVPIEIAKNTVVILDEQLMANLQRDTEQFFSEKSEKFFKQAAEQGVDYKRGIFLHGPPGNGKTTFIKHFSMVQKQAFSVVVEPKNFDGDMGNFLNQAFGKDAKKIIVFEDVDSIASRWEMRSEFLNFLDGVVPLHKTLILATSNYPHMLDDALLKRPSRFDQKYKIDLPSLKMRKKFLQHWFKDATEVELDRYAKKTEGFSGAYFKELYILKNLQDCTIDEAIEKLVEQLTMVLKSVQPTEEELKKDLFFVLFTDPEAAMAETAPKDLKSKFQKLSSTYAIEKKEETTEQKKVEAFFEIFKQDEERRLVTGPVLVPENIDLQDDVISEDEIEKAAHNYVLKLCFQDDPEFLKELGLSTKSKRGFMHVEFNRRIALVESYIAPVDFELNGRMVKKGTWVMTVKVFDDEAWKLVKAKKITGFSIGGRSKVIPEKAVNRGN